MISEGELDKIREQQELYFDKVVVIRRKAFDRDEFVTTTLGTDVPCRIARGFGFWRQVADRFQGINAHVITLPHDQAIQAGDQVVDGDDIYEVRDLRGKGSFVTARQVLTDLID